MRRRVLISGVSGLLGLNAAVQWSDEFEIAGCYLYHPVTVPHVETVRLDLENGRALRDFMAAFRPDIVLHTAGLTNVDQCEREPSLARRLHVDITRNVAAAAAAARARLVHISTDHIFDGSGRFYLEAAEPKPLNVYAHTKLDAEAVVESVCPGALIIRTNFLGWGTSIRSSLTDWILRSLAGGAPFDMFTDVFITPILINDLLDCLRDLLYRDIEGVIHVAGSERVSKHDIGVRTARSFGYDPAQIRRISVRQFPFVAVRPNDMSLATRRVSELLGKTMPDLDCSLSRLRQLREIGWPARLERAVCHD
jgi:dTDP-4-dehydrorhamnose reductase